MVLFSKSHRRRHRAAKIYPKVTVRPKVTAASSRSVFARSLAQVNAPIWERLGISASPRST